MIFVAMVSSTYGVYFRSKVKVLVILLETGEHTNEDSLAFVAVGGCEGQGISVDEGDFDLLLEEALDDLRVLLLPVLMTFSRSDADLVEVDHLANRCQFDLELQFLSITHELEEWIVLYFFSLLPFSEDLEQGQQVLEVLHLELFGDQPHVDMVQLQFDPVLLHGLHFPEEGGLEVEIRMEGGLLELSHCLE